MPALLLLADRETTEHTTPHGTVRMRKYASTPGREFVRAAVRAGTGGRAALVTLRPAAYPYAGAWLAALTEHAPAAADYCDPDMSPEFVRVVAEMTRTHANGVPRQSDGSVGWGVPGAAARVWPDGRLTVTSDAGVELSARLEGALWDTWAVAAVADAGLRLLCDPAARHITRTSEPSGWFRPLDRGYSGGGRERNGGQMYDGSSVAACTCGWRGALAAAKEHREKSGLVVHG